MRKGVVNGNVVKHSISLDPKVSGWADELANEWGYATNFSAFVAELVRRAKTSDDAFKKNNANTLNEFSSTPGRDLAEKMIDDADALARALNAKNKSQHKRGKYKIARQLKKTDHDVKRSGQP